MHLVALPKPSYCTNFTHLIKTVAPNVPKNARRPRGGFYRDGFDTTQKHRLKRLMVSILAGPTKIPQLVPPSRDPLDSDSGNALYTHGPGWIFLQLRDYNPSDDDYCRWRRRFPILARCRRFCIFDCEFFFSSRAPKRRNDGVFLLDDGFPRWVYSHLGADRRTSAFLLKSVIPSFGCCFSLLFSFRCLRAGV